MTRPRFTGAQAGAKAIKVYVCTNRQCEVHHRHKPPVQCHCGGIQFDRFDSVTEANVWASLRMKEKRGLITSLKRQVPFALLAHGPHGPVEVAKYIADFCFSDDEGTIIIADAKGVGGEHDPLFSLKRKIMQAMGFPITILNDR